MNRLINVPPLAPAEVAAQENWALLTVGKYGYVSLPSTGWEQLSGYTTEDLKELSLKEMVVEEEQQQFEDDIRSLKDAPLPCPLKFNIVNGKGEKQLVEWNAFRVPEADIITGPIQIGETPTPSKQGQGQQCLLHITKAASNVTDITVFAKEVASRLGEMFGAGLVYIRQVSPERKTLGLFARSGLQLNAKELMTNDSTTLESSRPECLPLNDKLIPAHLREQGIASGMCLMLSIGNKQFGNLGVFNDGRRVYKGWEVDLLRSVAEIFAQTHQRLMLEKQLGKVDKLLEGKVEERSKVLKNTIKELSSFNASVSHDLRTPVRSVQIFAHMIKVHSGHLLDESSSDLLNRIINSTEEMSELIDELLQLAQGDKKELNKVTVDTQELWEETIEQVLLQYQMRRGELEVVMNRAIPAMSGDRSMLKQVLINLFANAIKFSRVKNRPIIQIGYSEEHKAHFIKDNGVGLSAEEKEKIFMAHKLSKDSTDRAGGMGLTIIQRVINRHGGKVWVEGEKEVGTTFYFSLPA